MKSDARSRELLANLIPRLLVTTDFEAGRTVCGLLESGIATPVERQAADWVLRVAELNCSREQLSALDDWLGRSVEHEQIFTKLNMLWCHTEQLRGHPSEANDRKCALERALSLRTRILQHLLFLLRNEVDAELLTLETYRRLLLMDRSYRIDSRSIGPYVLRIATRVAQEHVRNSRLPADETSAADLLAGLSPREREVLVSLYLYGHTSLETAERLGITARAVRKRVASAMKHLHSVNRVMQTASGRLFGRTTVLVRDVLVAEPSERSNEKSQEDGHGPAA